MEYNAAPAPQRSLIRRLVPWTVSLGLFSGGGFGVYHYAVPNVGSGSAVADAGSLSSRPSSVAKDQINQLFSSPSTTSDSGYANRYAMGAAPPASMAAPPQLPPALDSDAEETPSPRSAPTISPQNPFAAAAAASDHASRYGAATPTDPAASVAADDVAVAAADDQTAQVEPTASAPPSHSIEAATDPTAPPAEITRGQEPADGNPLRAVSARSPAVDAGDAASLSQPASVSQASTTGSEGGAFAADTTPAASGAATATDGAKPLNEAAQAFAAPTRSGALELGPSQAVEPAAAPTPTLADPPDYPAGGGAQAFAAQSAATSPTAGLAADPGVTPTPGLAAADGAGRPGERILEGLQTPAITIQKLAPTEIQVGKKCTFAVRVQNNSQRTAHNVQIHDEVPLGTQLIGAAPKANVSGSHVSWDLGALSPGDERVVEMELMPTDEGELGSVAMVTFAAQASAKVRCTKPQLALRLTAGPRVMIGQQHIVQIEIANPGSGDATGVMLLETVPEGVSHEAGPALEFEVGALRPGESKQLDLVLTAEQAGRIRNAMTARADAGLEVEAVCEFEVIAPDLKVSVEGPKQRYLERPATYTVSVDNPGTASAKEVQLITQLPKGLQFVSANNMGEYDAATHSVRWSLAELPANERGTVELTALPVEAGEHTLQVASRAEQGLEDSTEAHVRVDGLVALSFEVEAADGAVEVGGEIAYDVTVVNQGSKAATNVQIVAAIPQGLRATGGQGATRHVVQGDKVVFAPLAQLAPKAEAKFRIQVQGLRAGDLRTKIMVTADEVTEPITKEQSTHVYADQ